MAARNPPAVSRQILILLENFTYPADTRVRNEAESLAAAGHRVTVLAPRGPRQASRELLRGVDVHRYRTVWATRSPWSYALEYGIAHLQLTLRSLAQLIRGADTLHLNGPPDTLALAGLLARLLGRKVVYDMHDSGPELFRAKFGSARLHEANPNAATLNEANPNAANPNAATLNEVNPNAATLNGVVPSRGVTHSVSTLASSFLAHAMLAAQIAALRCAHHVIVTNQTQRELAIARGARSPDHVTVVRNGPRIAEFPQPSPGTPGELAAPKLIYVGTLDVQDGVLDLPDLLCAPALSAAHLTIVGEGPARQELQARCRHAGVEDRVTFTGHVPHERVSRLIAEADIGIDPAPSTELNHGSTMIKVAEYMGAGRPLVAYDLRETRRTAGDTALYAPCGQPHAFVEHILQLARDGELRLHLGQLARARALELTWDRSEEALLTVYRSLA
jgi:glycosyltransferase involved in cell wall biosynthesis